MTYNRAQLSLPIIFRMADRAIEPIAKPKNTVDGSWDVCFSIVPVKRSTVDSPRETLLRFNRIFLLLYFLSAVCDPVCY